MAHRIGFLNDVVPAGTIDDAVDAIVDQIRQTGTRATKTSTRLITRAARSEMLEDAGAVEASLWWDQFETAERERRVDAFLAA